MSEKYLDSSLSPKERARDLLPRLSLREKVGQLNQRLYGFKAYDIKDDELILTEEFKSEVDRWGGLGVLYGLYRADPWADRDFETGLAGDLAFQAYNLVQDYVKSRSRFKIPALMSSECPHGHQALDGYLLPVNLAMGATWNPELVKSAYRICARQMNELGVDFALVSMLDVLRDPRWGRCEECFSEDPVLCSKMAGAVVEGCCAEGISVVAKHFCAQGETTGGVNASAARIGERELREIHFPSMKAACAAGVEGVMAAYNEIDGVPCHANSWLLDDVLRGEMGFKGIVMADGTAVDRLDTITGDNIISGALALESGVDISLWDSGFTCLEETVKSGSLDESVIDKAALRVLEAKFSRGLFECCRLESKAKSYSVDEFPESLELARQAPILLKNNGILPLDESVKRVVVMGPYADDIYALMGDYSPPIREEGGFSILRGMREFSPNGVEIVTPSLNLTEGEIREAISRSDVAVLVLGGSSSRFGGADFDENGAALATSAGTDCGEGVDIACLNLPYEQRRLAELVVICGKPVVTVVNAGRPYVINPVLEHSDALLYCFYTGPQGGRAVAEILWGVCEPAGRLPVSIPLAEGQLPVYYNAKSSYKPMKYADLSLSDIQSFGFGLGYGEIEINGIKPNTEQLSIEELKSERFEISMTIKNVGGRGAWAVPILFIRDLQSSTVRRVKEMKDFTKLYLEVGESSKCVLSVGFGELSVWDSKMNFTPEAGDVELMIYEGEKYHSKLMVKIIR